MAKSCIMNILQILLLFIAIFAIIYSIFYRNHELVELTSERETRISVRQLLEPIESDHVKHEKLQEDLFLWSAYYHENSEVLGNNTLSFIIAGDVKSTHEKLTFTAYNQTHNVTIEAPLNRITPSGSVCRWGNYYSITKTLPGMTSLVVSAVDKEVQIPVYRPVTVKHEVVTCVSPLVANDKWPETIFAAILYKYYESWAHFYVRSIATPIHQVMQVYKDQINENMYTIQPWAQMRFSQVSSKGLNPNEWMEFSGVEAAYTDCLMQYKDSAQYITFVDLEEFILPRKTFNFPREFAALFTDHPGYGLFRYHSWDVTYNISTVPERFHLHTFMNTFTYAKTLNTSTTETKFVTKPELVNAVSRFGVPELKEEFKEFQLNHSLYYVMSRFKEGGVYTNTSVEDQTPYWGRKYNESEWQSDIIEPYSLWNIYHEMRRFRFSPNVGELWHVMSKSTFYRELIPKCIKEHYEDERLRGPVCFTAEKCKLPKSIEISCTNARAEYTTASNPRDGINLHFAIRSWFSVEDGCIP